MSFDPLPDMQAGIVLRSVIDDQHLVGAYRLLQYTVERALDECRGVVSGNHDCDVLAREEVHDRTTA